MFRAAVVRSAQLAMVALLVGMLTPGQALGAGSELGGTPPTVSFVDQRPLSVELATLREDGGLEILLHNDLNRAQPVTLRIVGLAESEDEGVASLLAEEGEPKSLGPGETALVKIPLADSAAEPKAASAEGVLIASGESGGLARRDLTVSFAKESSTPVEDSKANVLRPSQAVDVTLVAVNFIPSLLSNVVSFALFLLAVALLALVILDRQLVRRWPWVRLALIASATVLTAVTATVLLNGRAWKQPSAHAISPRPIPVAAALGDQTVGAAASENGRIAQVVLEGHKMKPVGLEAATTFEGKYDLTPGEDGGDGAVTINVRDFWAYALLTIFLGLLTAYLLRRWFERERPRAKTGLRFDRLVSEYQRRQAEFTDRSAGAIYAALSLDQRLKGLRKEIEQKLEDGDKDAAGKLIDDLAPYLTKYWRLREALLSLDDASRQLLDQFNKRSLKVEQADLDAYYASRRLLAGAARAVAPDQDADALAEKLKQVEEQDALVRGLLRQLEAVLSHLDAAESLEPNAGSHLQALKDVEKSLRKIARQTIQVSSGDDLKAVEGKDDEAVADLLAVRDEIAEEKAPRQVILSVRDRSLLPIEGFQRLTGAEAAFIEAIVESPPPEPNLSLKRIRWAGSTDDAIGDSEVPREDEVEITATFTAPDSLPLTQVDIELEPGETVTQEVKPAPGDRAAVVFHRYSTAGHKEVVVRSHADGRELGRATLTVSAETRVEKEERDISDSDYVAGVIAFALASASGMAALYFADPSWGEPVDYLAALVWGGISGAGVKLATDIADRVFSS